MQAPCRAPRWKYIAPLLAVVSTGALIFPPDANAQASRVPDQRPGLSESAQEPTATDLQMGIALTGQGNFQAAIPHLLAAKKQGERSFALDFDLALCYVATLQFGKGIEILEELRAKNPNNGNVHSLLAQAYVWRNQMPQAAEAFDKASSLSPKNEKMFLLIGDACMENGQYSFGLDVTNRGLQHHSNSAGLLYQRGMFLTLLDRFDTGKLDLERASQVGKGTEIGFLAAAQKATFEGNIPEVIRAAREGSRKFQHDALLTLLGEALLRSGVSPGQPEFSEAVSAMEKSIALRPDVPVSRIALGKLYLMASRTDEAIGQFEAARQMDSSNTAVFSNLAKAYRLRGDQAKAKEMLAILSQLNQEQAANIRSAPGERKSSYLGSRPGSSQATTHPENDKPREKND